MGTQALYNRWRGQTFEDILGQPHVTTTLENQIRAGRIGHAYLFAGVRGTGKTSTARIMAKAVNCVGNTEHPPCNQCHICRSISEGRSLDLIEVDAASNRGIDEIRELRDKVNFAPSECRFKVYVIDEVHMLTNEAFNALLKTLEEPPAHVIFILCTTEAHRLPQTVLSRCQRFDFRRGSVSILLQKLNRICQEEKIAVAPDALEFIARRATGSFRDAESLLDQLAAYQVGEITLDLVQKVLGTVSSGLVLQIVTCLVLGDVAAGLRAINQVFDSGAEPRQFLSEILDCLRACMLLKLGTEDELNDAGEESLAGMRRVAAEPSCTVDLLVRALKLFNDAGNGLRVAAHPQIPLELAFVESVLLVRRPPAAAETVGSDVRALASSPNSAKDSKSGPQHTSLPPADPPAKAAGERAPRAGATAEAPPVPPRVSEDAESAAPSPSIATPALDDERPTQEAVPASGAQLTLEWVRGNWKQALLRIRPISPQVQALLNSSEPIEAQGNMVTLGCVNALVCEKLAEEKRRDIVERVLTQVLGVDCHIKCIVQAAQREAGSNVPPKRPQPDDLLVAKDARGDLRQRLLDHPAVKELEKRGGRVAKVSLAEESEQEDDRG